MSRGHSKSRLAKIEKQVATSGHKETKEFYFIFVHPDEAGVLIESEPQLHWSRAAASMPEGGSADD